MPLTLHIDAERWRAHHDDVIARYPGIVPVIKGNGYGPGLARLAVEAQRLGRDVVAVGSIDEVPSVAAELGARMVVRHPHHPAVPEEPLDDAVRIAFVVDRRLVVDDAFERARMLEAALAARAGEQAVDADRRARESRALFTVSRPIATADALETSCRPIAERLARAVRITGDRRAYRELFRLLRGAAQNEGPAESGS